MRLLLDTHVLLWSLTTPDKLSPRLQARVWLTADNEVFVSAASLWELSIKSGLKRHNLGVEPEAVWEAVRAIGFTELPVYARHALLVKGLPAIHHDPFDRLLVAQAMAEQLLLVTNDRAVKAYPGAVWMVE